MKTVKEDLTTMIEQPNKDRDSQQGTGLSSKSLPLEQALPNMQMKISTPWIFLTEALDLCHLKTDENVMEAFYQI